MEGYKKSKHRQVWLESVKQSTGLNTDGEAIDFALTTTMCMYKMHVAPPDCEGSRILVGVDNSFHELVGHELVNVNWMESVLQTVYPGANVCVLGQWDRVKFKRANGIENREESKRLKCLVAALVDCVP